MKTKALLILLIAASLASAQSYTLTPTAKQQFFSAAGVPLAGGFVYTYLAGTTTPSATYSDSSGTPNANPIVLDSGGFATIYLAAHNYKYVVKTSAGVTVYTQDNIAPTASTGGGGVTTFTAGNLSPVFSTSVANPTSAPALTFALTNAAAYSFLGNATNSSGAPTYAKPDHLLAIQADYSVTCAVDYGALLSQSVASKTVTLPATVCADGWHMSYQNSSIGDGTIARNGNLIDYTAANLTISSGSGINIWSNGTAWYTERGTGGSSSSCTSPTCWTVGTSAVAGTNTPGAKGFFGTGGGSIQGNYDIGIVTNSNEIATFTTGGNLGLSVTAPVRRLHVKETGNSFQLRLEGDSTSTHLGAGIEFYEGVLPAGQIIGSLGSLGSLTFAAGPPGQSMNWYVNNGVSSMSIPTGTTYLTFTKAADWTGVATGAVTGAPSNSGRIIYDKTLQHFYYSENGGTYQQFGSGGGGGNAGFSASGTGWASSYSNSTGGTADERYAYSITNGTDGSVNTPGFSNNELLFLNNNSYNGIYSYDGQSKLSFYGILNRGSHNSTGQHFGFANQITCLGMSDCFFQTQNGTIAGGAISGDEGSGFLTGWLVQSPAPCGEYCASRATTTISSIPTQPLCTTTLTQAVTKNVAAQSVTVSSSATCSVNDWITVGQEGSISNSPHVEAVKVTAVSAGTISAIFRHNHDNGESIKPSTVLVTAGGYLAQGRQFVNLTTTPYTTGSVTAINGSNQVTGSGTTWANSTVGGNAYIKGCFSVRSDDMTYQVSPAIPAWYPIESVDSATQITFLHRSPPGGTGYSGNGASTGEYSLAPCARILNFESTGSGTNNTVILEANSFTWTVADSAEIALSSDGAMIGQWYRMGANLAGVTAYSYLDARNIGREGFSQGVTVSQDMLGATTGVVDITGGSCTTATWVSGTKFVTGSTWNTLGITLAGVANSVSSVSSGTVLTLGKSATCGTGVIYVLYKNSFATAMNASVAATGGNPAPHVGTGLNVAGYASTAAILLSQPTADVNDLRGRISWGSWMVGWDNTGSGHTGAFGIAAASFVTNSFGRLLWKTGSTSDPLTAYVTSFDIATYTGSGANSVLNICQTECTSASNNYWSLFAGTSGGLRSSTTRALVISNPYSGAAASYGAVASFGGVSFGLDGFYLGVGASQGVITAGHSFVSWPMAANASRYDGAASAYKWSGWRTEPIMSSLSACAAVDCGTGTVTVMALTGIHESAVTSTPTRVVQFRNDGKFSFGVWPGSGATQIGPVTFDASAVGTSAITLTVPATSGTIALAGGSSSWIPGTSTSTVNVLTSGDYYIGTTGAANFHISANSVAAIDVDTSGNTSVLGSLTAKGAVSLNSVSGYTGINVSAATQFHVKGTIGTSGVGRFEDTGSTVAIGLYNSSGSRALISGLNNGGTDELDLKTASGNGFEIVGGSGGSIGHYLNTFNVFNLVADSGVADGATAMYIRYNRAGTYYLQQVTFGAADSGGTGYRLLRVPNN